MPFWGDKHYYFLLMGVYLLELSHYDFYENDIHVNGWKHKTGGETAVFVFVVSYLAA